MEERQSETKNKFILVIEDEKIIASLIIQRLKKHGYETELAEDGLSGLESIQKKKPDLVLLDMNLPGLDGFGVLQKLKELELLPALPVMVISNSGQPVDINRAMATGIRDYLVKVNFDPNEVVEKVDAILKASGK